MFVIITGICIGTKSELQLKCNHFGVDWKIVSEWNFEKQDGRHVLDWSDSGRGQVRGGCEYGNEISGSIKFGELIDQPRNYWLFKKVSSSWSQLCVSYNKLLSKKKGKCTFCVCCLCVCLPIFVCLLDVNVSHSRSAVVLYGTRACNPPIVQPWIMDGQIQSDDDVIIVGGKTTASQDKPVRMGDLFTTNPTQTVLGKNL